MHIAAISASLILLSRVASALALKALLSIVIVVLTRENKRRSYRRRHWVIASLGRAPDDFVQEQVVGGILLGKIHLFRRLASPGR